VRVATIYDIHGNIDALDAVLKEIDAERPDRIVVGGDMALGPFPLQTMERLRARKDLIYLRGNCDREMVTPAVQQGAWGPAMAWAGQEIGAAHREFLTTLPTTVILDLDGLGPTIFCHGTPRSDTEIVTRITPEARMREVLADVRETVVVYGHIHMQHDIQIAGKRLINSGSVGLPYEGRRGAFWAMLGPEVTHRRTEYDVDKAVERIRATAFPNAEEFAHRLLEPASPTETTETFERMAQQQLGV
jgi:predicted phosphodiesterase